MVGQFEFLKYSEAFPQKYEIGYIIIVGFMNKTYNISTHIDTKWRASTPALLSTIRKRAYWHV